MGKYSLIKEEGELPVPDASQTGAGTQPPASDASPVPQQGAEVQKPVYDKPYQDLARVLYKALRIDFNALEQTAQQKILNLHPDNIKTDQQGVTIFKEVEKMLNETEGIETQGGSFGPGAKKI